MGKSYDVVVAGGGHNGLIAACYLAKAGQSVCVVEQMPYVGGGVSSGELTIPGFIHDHCSISHANMQLNPIFQKDELELFSKYGLKYDYPEESITFLYPDDKYFTIYKDLDKTCENIAQFSQRDAEAYRMFAGFGMQALAGLEEGTYRPPVPYGAMMAGLEQMLGGTEMIRFMHMSLNDAVEELFESIEMRLAFTRALSEMMLSPDTASSAIYLVGYIPVAHKYGFCLPIGGSGKFAEALAACIEDHGGEIRTSCMIEKFKVSGGQCSGVVLESGEEIDAKKAVVTNFSVQQMPGMVGEENLPDDYKMKIGRLKPADYMTFHMELALNETPVYKNDMTRKESWFIEMIDHYDWVDYMRTYDDLRYGIPNTREPLIVCPTILDPSRAPEGKHTLYVYQYGPQILREGGAKGWLDIKEEMMDGLCETLDNCCTNMGSDNILARWAMTPYEYGQYNPSWPNGDFQHFNSTVLQSGGNRPFPGWSNYRTPVDKLYMVGPSTHPGWSVNGSSRAGMWTIFEDLGMNFEDMTK